ncbi:MAG: Nramp family divalent metal transporter [Planctomycetota bacterium]|jgi:Mn2+/Fe2+ NRAMP family transporter
MMTRHNKAQIHPKEPPKGLFASLRYLGPGLILSASVVGSGELIATTTLGAKAGFAVLWVLILGCLIKVAVQLEYGRHCICYGKPSFQAWNQLPGLQFLGLHWSIHFGLLSFAAMVIGMGAVMGGAAQAARHAFGISRIELWIGILWVIIALLVCSGKYRMIEFAAVIMNFLFLTIILFCVIAVQNTEFAFGPKDIAGGFSMKLPPETIVLALTAFGITGIGSGEIIMYPYWCLEKGYAAWTGPRDESSQWAVRARGWIRIMKLDAVVSMIVYTVVTVAFYFLGATVLHAQAEIKDGEELILQLSRIFTDVLGPSATWLFMTGAFVVLFSTAFANTAGYSHVWADLLGLYRLYDMDNPRSKRRTLTILIFVLPGIWGFFYLWLPQPVLLVTILGIANSAFLIVVAYQAMLFRYRQTDKRIAPGKLYDVFLLVSTLSIGFVAVRSIIAALSEWLELLG